MVQDRNQIAGEFFGFARIEPARISPVAHDASFIVIIFAILTNQIKRARSE
jgi:hypothetical protein